MPAGQACGRLLSLLRADTPEVCASLAGSTAWLGFLPFPFCLLNFLATFSWEQFWYFPFLKKSEQRQLASENWKRLEISDVHRREQHISRGEGWVVSDEKPSPKSWCWRWSGKGKKPSPVEPAKDEPQPPFLMTAVFSVLTIFDCIPVTGDTVKCQIFQACPSANSCHRKGDFSLQRDLHPARA